MLRSNSKWNLTLLTIALIALSTFFFSNPNNQGADWTFPYYSGAANFERLFDWQISPSDFEKVKQLAPEEYRHYKHPSTQDVVPNTVNNYGYVLVALTSQTLFPFLGDLQGTILLQLLIHIFAALAMVLWVLKTPIQRYGFILLYAANPLIIYFTTFPFYYFWMFLPSMAFAVLIFRPEWYRWLTYAALPILLFSLLVRPTTLFLAILFFLTAILLSKSKVDKLISISAMGIFGLGVIFISMQSTGSPWHAMYVGIGAYENNVGIKDLGDDRGYEFFYSQTGIVVSTDAVKGNWNDGEVRDLYMDTLKNRYLQILRKKPVLLIRNALFNSLQVFSVGYIVDSTILTWVSTAFGALVVAFLLYTRQFIWILAILASAGGFAWYFPPIPAYNFAAYMLIVFGVLLGSEVLFRKYGFHVYILSDLDQSP